LLIDDRTRTINEEEATSVSRTSNSHKKISLATHFSIKKTFLEANPASKEYSGDRILHSGDLILLCGGGLPLKRALLAMEGITFDKQDLPCPGMAGRYVFAHSQQGRADGQILRVLQQRLAGEKADRGN